MNILAVSSLQSDNKKNWQLKSMSVPRFGLVMAKPLQQDTVSFGATVKKLTNRGAGVSLKTARKIHSEADVLQKEIKEFFDKFFKDLIVSKENPKNVIEYIKGRTKTPESIVEKSATRDWNSMSEIFSNMTDLNGVKIVLRDGSKTSVKQVLKKLENAIEQGFLICTEIENKRPIAAQKLKAKDADKWDYATFETLQNFRKFAEAESKRKIKFEPVDYTDANYTAIHFLFRFPAQKRSFELQLMGRNVAAFKDMDDIIYKILNNKNVNKAYQPMKEILAPLIVEEDIENLKLYNEQIKDLTAKITDGRNTSQHIEVLKQRLDKLKEMTEKLKEKILISELFDKYRAEAFLAQREKAPNSYSKSKREYFTPLKYDIPEEFDFNNLYEIYSKCTEKANASKSKKS